MKAYNEILNDLKTAYFEKTGENPEQYSDLGARFQAVASELLSLYHFADYVRRQAFPQTATDDCLDKHAALRGMQRKTAEKARGLLRFYCRESPQEAINIPRGTVCAAEGKPFLQFVTLVNATIPVGGEWVDVLAEAMQAGRSYNVGENEVSRMVNPVLGIARVTNPQGFSGGSDAEDDVSLRARVTDAWRTVDTGVSLESFRKEIMKIAAVVRCNVLYDEQENRLTVCLKTQYGDLSQAVRDRIEEILFAAELTATEVVITTVTAVPYALSVHLTAEKGRADGIAEAAREQLAAAAARVDIGESVCLSALTAGLYLIDGVKTAELSSPSATGDMLFCAGDELLTLDRLEVACYE